MSAALVTGSSSGIGYATAVALQRAGYEVYATARRAESCAALAREGLHGLHLDVTDEDSMREAVATVEEAHGRVSVLVDNAGYGQLGAVEEVPIERWRAQFETNVFGCVRMAQLVLPAMRAAGDGRIIIVGSMGGEHTFPFTAPYHATKYALESIADALRFEVAPFGVHVALIQPGVTKTPLADATVEAIRGEVGSPYRAALAGFGERGRASYASGRGVDTPEHVAKVILRAVAAERPRARYKVGLAPHVMTAARRVLPDRAWDGLLRRAFPTAEAPS